MDIFNSCAWGCRSAPCSDQRTEAYPERGPFGKYATQISIPSLHGKVRPLDPVQNHHIVGLVHTQFFIEAVGVFIEAGVHDDIFFAACHLVQLLHQCGADALTGVLTHHPQIGDKQPVSRAGFSARILFSK